MKKQQTPPPTLTIGPYVFVFHVNKMEDIYKAKTVDNTAHLIIQRMPVQDQYHATWTFICHAVERDYRNTAEKAGLPINFQEMLATVAAAVAEVLQTNPHMRSVAAFKDHIDQATPFIELAEAIPPSVN